MEIPEIRLNRIAKEIDNPISNWGVGYTAEVMMQFAIDYHNDRIDKLKNGSSNPNDYKLITNEYYNTELTNPVFMGQSTPDKNGEYYMFWRNEFELYKTKNRI